jgi:hypothetical protein
VALAAHVDKEVEATVLFEERKQIQVLLPDFGLQARYYCKRVPAEGDTVRLVVVKVEPRLDVLVLREL